MHTPEELKKMKSEQLTKTLRDTRMDLAKYRFESRTGQSKNHHRIELAKKQVARILTILQAQSAA